MKIDNSITKLGQLQPEEPRARRPQAAPTEPTKGGQADARIELTPASAQLQKLESQLASLPEIDMSKVEAVRQSIADGTFNANEDAIAEKLLASVVEGLQRQAR